MSLPSAISVWPEQKSMSGSAISAAPLGGPEAGFHSRGSEAEVVPVSYLPQASTLPVGNRLMCSGTISQETGASHSPLVASGGSALSVTAAEVAEGPVVLKRRVCAPVPAIPRSTNLATPVLAVVTLVFPWSVPLPPAIDAVTDTLGTPTPLASFTTTVGCRLGIQTSRSRALEGGWMLILSEVGAPARSGTSGPVCRSGEALSPVQVIVPAAKAAASSRKEARRRRVRIGPRSTRTAHRCTNRARTRTAGAPGSR